LNSFLKGFPLSYVHSSFASVPSVIVISASSDTANPEDSSEYSVVVPTSVLCVCTAWDNELNSIVASLLLEPQAGFVIVPITRPAMNVANCPSHVSSRKVRWPV